MTTVTKSSACKTCKSGRCGRIHHCVDCGRECCSHTIRPQPTPAQVGKVGRCNTCLRNVFKRA